jgi:hypothetical protein
MGTSSADINTPVSYALTDADDRIYGTNMFLFGTSSRPFSTREMNSVGGSLLASRVDDRQAPSLAVTFVKLKSYLKFLHILLSLN